MRAALRPFRVPADAILTLVFVDDAAMRELNRRHRGKVRTTDVLSFGQGLPSHAKGVDAIPVLRRDVDGTLDLGDVVISVPQATAQARRGRHALSRELAFLAAHGALHLLGFEDETRAGHRDMVRRGREAVREAIARARRS